MCRSLFKYLVPLPFFLMGCDSADEPKVGKAQQQLTPEEQRTLRFELASDWQVWSGQGTIENDPLHSEGSLSLEVVSTGTTSGFVGVRNLTPLTKDQQAAPEVVGFDVWIPPAQLNPNWHGDTQLSIDAPSAGIYQQYLGYRSFQALPKGQFVRVEFPVADWIRNALNGANYTDLRFVIAINTTPGNPAHYLDNFTLGPVDPTCTPVDDGNPCTADECANGQTTHVPLAPGALCTDANVCNGTETCDGAGTCQAGSPLVLDDGNPCTADSCDPTGGVTNTPVAAGTACDDADVCNGAEFCDAEGACQDAPDLDPDDGNPCTTDSCDPVTGVNNDPVAVGTSCADADVCNGAETCSASGTCEAGTPLVVDDGNVCTADSCDPVGGVSNEPVATGTSCDDGNVCNGVSTCDASASCVAGAPPTLDDGNVCTADACDPVAGVSHVPVATGVSCTDENACNGDEACDGAGACLSGTAPEVDDDNPCTADACDPVTGVSHTPVSAGVSCTDGDLCNGAETCDGAGACQIGVAPDVDDNNPCTADACDPVTGVSHTPVSAGVSCGDGNACNGDETCDGAGACQWGTAPEVNDNNPCTVDACDPVTGVSHIPVSAGMSCDDDNICNGVETCDGAGLCAAGTAPDVDDDNPCTFDSCDPLFGVIHGPLNAGVSCNDDGDACNGSSACNGAGSCVAGAPPVVDDGNPCTADACDPVTGVSHTPVSAGVSCDDGLSCNGAETCDGAGNCQVGVGAVVDDGNPCTVDVCDESGVTHVPVAAGTTCADADLCNGTESCDAFGACQAGTPIETDDGNECTIGSCDSITGVVTQVSAPSNSPCGDGDLCNGMEFCDGSGVCQAGTPLDPDDGNACTVDSCDPLFGVDNDPAPAGLSCEDVDVCNGAETCDGFGACQAGSPLEPDDGNSCTIDRCDPISGVANDPLEDGASCSDGDACTVADTCDAGVCTPGVSIVCGALSTCHDAGVCDPATGLCSDPVKPDGSACDDGVACTAGDACQAGACIGGDSPDVEDAPCRVAECDGETGGVIYTFAEEGSPCELDACTQGACSAEGECLMTETTVVDDLDPCTVDFCDPILGPVNVECSEIDMTVATTVLSSYSWLFTGAFPVQRGVNPADIEERRAALISGTVTNLAGDPLPSVRVSVHNHPEFGQTVTQANGRFQMVVNGGGTMQVQFHKAGYLDSARRVDPKWNQTHTVDDVIMIVPDPVVTEISLDDAGEDFQVARSSIVSDEDGQRQGTLLVPPGTVATMRLPDGTEQMLDTMHVRITEFTVGPEGPDAMPASLPANTAYTYAFEANADEAVAAGAPSIEFSEPLVYYVENFIGFPVGETVPVGAYDRERGLWVPHDSGVVIEILSIEAGVASVDLTGNGIAATPAELTAGGITSAELERLGVLFAPGVQLWRVLIPHFTQAYDCNWPFHFPEDAVPPPPERPERLDPPPPEDPCEVSQASTLECQAQVLREEVRVAGSPFSLHYTSARVPGRSAGALGFDILLTSESPPASLKRVDLSVVVAGRDFTQSFTPSARQIARFEWDGNDSSGRMVQGRTNANVRVSYVYDGVYGVATRFNNPSLGQLSQLSGDRTREELYSSRDSSVSLGSWHAGIGGWSLGIHHSYDPASGELVLGSGSSRFADSMPEQVDNVLGEFPGPFVEGGVARNMRPVGASGLAVAPDGSVYVCAGFSGSSGNRLVRVSPQGIAYLVAGGAKGTFSGDGGPAVQAAIDCNDSKLALGPDGSIYFTQFLDNRIRRIDPSGTITTVVGTGTGGFSGDGGPAVDAQIGRALNNLSQVGVAAGPDGTLYVADYSNRRLRRVSTDGLIDTIAGNGQDGPPPEDGVPALEAAITPVDVAVDEHGTVFIFHTSGQASSLNSAIYSLAADGLLRHVAGCIPGGECSDGPDSLATETRFFSEFSSASIAVRGGYVYFTGVIRIPPLSGNYRQLMTVGPDGILRSSIGQSAQFLGPALPYRSGNLLSQTPLRPTRVAAGPQSVIFNEALALAPSVTRSTRPLPGISSEDIVVPSSSGLELFHFDQEGRHLRTLHAHTFAPIYLFSYDSTGLLSAVEDGSGLITMIERESGGNPVAIVAPYGQRTELAVDAEGYLTQISRPDGEHFMTYGAGGLLATFQGPTGEVATMSYDELGRITEDVDREGARMSLARAEVDNGWKVTRTTSEGREYTYMVERQWNGVESSVNTLPDGTSSTNTRNSEDVTLAVLPDGTQITTTPEADPISGMLDPLLSRRTTLPSGLFQTSTSKRTVTQSNPQIPSTMTSFLDSVTINNLVFTTEFIRNDLQYRTTTPEGRSSSRFIDDIGRTVRVEAPGTATLRTQYDAEKVTAIITDPDGVVDSGDERTTEMFYDASGRLTSVVDPLTHETFFGSYDVADRPQTITLPDDSEVHMTYDVEGNVASVTPPGKAAHGMTYKSYGRIESYSPPVGNSVQFFYDLDRRMDLIDFGLDAFSQPNQVDFEYDVASGQLSRITSPTGVINVGFTNGHMTTLTAPSMAGSITTSIDYDGFLPTSLSWAGPVAGEVNWTYNDRFLIETETIGALPETTVTYQYDDDGLVAQAGDLEITRDPASGRVVQKTIGRVRESFEYNEFAELSRQTVEFLEADMTTVRETLYDVVYDDDGVNGDRDALGRITKKTEWIVSGDVPNGDGTPRALDSRTYDYGYNPEGRPWLESVAVDGNVVSSYSYDDNGNRIAVELSWSQLGYDASFDVSLTDAETEYDSADRLLAYGSKSYTWNNFGQLESMTDSDPNEDGDTSDSEVTFYQYDLFGNLLRVDLPDGRAIEYDVDGAGRRVGRRELDASGVEVSFRGWIYRDLLRPIAEVDANGDVLARYTYADGHGARQNGVEQLSTRLGANQDTSLPYSGTNVPELIEWLDPATGSVGSRLKIVANQVGSVKLLVDVASGEVVQRIEHDDFGRVVFDSSPDLQPFGFAGGLYDSNSSIVRFGARDYSASFGRWLGRDPVRFAGGQENLYAYLGSDSNNRTDANGTGPIACGVTVAVCLGLAAYNAYQLGSDFMECMDRFDKKIPDDDDEACEKDPRQHDREVAEAAQECLGDLAGDLVGSAGQGLICAGAVALACLAPTP